MDKAQRTPLTVLRRDWLNQVFADAKVDASAFKVAFDLGRYMTIDKSAEGYETTADIYRKTGKVHIWPKQVDLADECHLDPQTVSRCIATLIARKHLRLIRRGNQFKGSNKYAVLFWEKQP